METMRLANEVILAKIGHTVLSFIPEQARNLTDLGDYEVALALLAGKNLSAPDVQWPDFRIGGLVGKLTVWGAGSRDLTVLNKLRQLVEGCY